MPIRHIPYTANFAADKMSEMARELPLDQHVVNGSPARIVSTMLQDVERVQWNAVNCKG